MMNSERFLIPEWPAPSNIRAASTTRLGGFSQGDWQGLNLASHVEDDELHVLRNRALLQEDLQLPNEPIWLDQVHGATVADDMDLQHNTCADARYSREKGHVCIALTADCLPVLFCNKAGTEVAAAHAGWRGLVAGVLQQTVAKFDSPSSEIVAWLGPAIGPHAFEVGDEVRQAFVSQFSEDDAAFAANRPGHSLADIYALARNRLQAVGVNHIYGGEYCTYSDPVKFYSFRRDGRTGRMASLVWIT